MVPRSITPAGVTEEVRHPLHYYGVFSAAAGSLPVGRNGCICNGALYGGAVSL